MTVNRTGDTLSYPPLPPSPSSSPPPAAVVAATTACDIVRVRLVPSSIVLSTDDTLIVLVVFQLFSLKLSDAVSMSRIPELGLVIVTVTVPVGWESRRMV